MSAVRWLIVLAVAWPFLSLGLALLIGAVIAAADQREHPPEEWR